MCTLDFTDVWSSWFPEWNFLYRKTVWRENRSEWGGTLDESLKTKNSIDVALAIFVIEYRDKNTLDQV